ncbi:drug/metabolite transporter (DMT)-like permease [Hamadaea flava]|uniref:DMT family transporter n=1 Tax=Hamadaea flava TaxID=1742688 RepID=A0ABV8LID5_9ACTN|nr:DMT family transporter [Hamadaea flava]MCP2325589.1 drug/metabolite transporter (DMT)-like permease [Hamadaea flava]
MKISLPTLLALTLAVVAISTSGPLIAYAAAPALALAFWRNALATAVLTPAALVTRRAELARLWRGKEFRWSVLAGLALAVHFATWMAGAQLTAVATATALAATQPVWAGLIAYWQGDRPTRAMWLGILAAVLGVTLATGADVGGSGRALLGDVLALIGGLAAAVYTVLGQRARAQASTTSYTTICYAVCAAVLLCGCVLFRVPLNGYAWSTWLAILGLTVGTQLLGHSMFNYALHELPATAVSVLVMLEVPGAALISWLWLDQRPAPLAWAGIALLVSGVAFVILGSAKRRPVPVNLEL